MKIAIEHLLGLRYKLRMMVVKVEKFPTPLGEYNADIIDI